ncbi:MAG: type III-B CRISPR module RAMP protein Cmr6 [Burkholderiaceae bacterium]|nr:type III-B CRISPR module RAMP protein Cmr6 [Burkholderiaceae bacterium]
MPIAAIPRYLGNDFKDASPGMRFGLLLPVWTSRADQEKEVKERAARRSREGQEVSCLLKEQGMDATIAALCQRERNPLAALWDKNDFAARQAWQELKTLNPRDRATAKALLARQQALAQTLPAVLQLQATAVAPFTTGLGNEHPLENGFAFLNPYGLPYLPGSGVKGVLRRAAQELASGTWQDTRGWRADPSYRLQVGKQRIALSMIDVLFGREAGDGDTDHVRGALSFWDVIPQIAGDSLMVEIMTPHQSHYYQQRPDRPSGGAITPHDSGQPNPICFLTVPPGSSFVFHVTCDTHRLALLMQQRQEGAPDLLQEGETHWQRLLAGAFEHAFAWLGFGAKTSVGYGAMALKPDAKQEGRSSVNTETWDNATLTWEPGPQQLKAAVVGEARKVTAPLKGAEAAKVFADAALFERLKNKKELKKMRVEVRIDGNHITLLRVLS